MALFNITPTPINGGTLHDVTRFGVVQLTPTKYVVAFQQTAPDNILIQVIDLNGISAPTQSIPLTILNNYTINTGIKLIKITSTKILLVMTLNNSNFNFIVISIDGGNNITFGNLFTSTLTCREMNVVGVALLTPDTVGLFAIINPVGQDFLEYSRVTISNNEVVSHTSVGTSRMNFSSAFFANLYLKQSKVDSSKIYILFNPTNPTGFTGGNFYVFDTSLALISNTNVNAGVSDLSGFEELDNGNLIVMCNAQANYFVFDPNNPSTPGPLLNFFGRLGNGWNGNLINMESDQLFFVHTNTNNGNLIGHFFKYTESVTNQIYQSPIGFVTIAAGSPGLQYLSTSLRTGLLNDSIYKVSDDLGVVFFANESTKTISLRLIIKILP